MNIFDHRRQQFRQLYKHLDETDGVPGIRCQQNEDELVLLAKLRVIPVRNPNYSLEKTTDTWDYHSGYRLQIYVSTLKRAVIENDWSQATVREKLADIESRLESHPNRKYPADGSKGQAKVAMTARKRAYQWLLGEYHGMPLEDDDLFESSSASVAIPL